MAPILGVLVTWGVIVPNVPDINHLNQDAPLLWFQDSQLSVAERACQKDSHIMESQEAETEEMGTLSWPSSSSSRSPAHRMVMSIGSMDLPVLDSPRQRESEVYLQAQPANVLGNSEASQADCNDESSHQASSRLCWHPQKPSRAFVLFCFNLSTC